MADPVGAVINGEIGRLDQPDFTARFHAVELVTSSMDPNLVTGEMLLTDRAAYSAEPVRRADIVEYRLTASQAAVCGSSVPFTQVKRVLGLPGDRIEVPAGKAEVIVNGTPFTVDKAVPNPRRNNSGILADRVFDVPPGMLFILGDNRPDSCDSSLWRDPFLPIGNVLGRVAAIYFPRARAARILPGGSIQPVDVSASASRPRFDYAIILGRAAARIGQASETLRVCATGRECPELELQRSTERALGVPVTGRTPFLRRKRIELAGAIRVQLRYLQTPARRVRHDCAGPIARGLAAALARDRRMARSRPVTARGSRTVAVETERHLTRAVTRTLSCWG